MAWSTRRRVAWIVVAAVVGLLLLAAFLLSRPERVARFALAQAGQALGLEITASGAAEYRIRGTPTLVVRDVVARLPGTTTPVMSADRVLLSGFKNEKLKPLTGKTLSEVAHMREKSPEETAIELVIEDDSRVDTAYFLMDEANVRRNIAWPWTMVGSDAGSVSAEGVFLESNPHPRAYGSFARFLGKYVREEKVIPLEQAIHRLTGMSVGMASIAVGLLIVLGTCSPDYYMPATAVLVAASLFWVRRYGLDHRAEQQEGRHRVPGGPRTQATGRATTLRALMQHLVDADQAVLCNRQPVARLGNLVDQFFAEAAAHLADPASRDADARCRCRAARGRRSWSGSKDPSWWARVIGPRSIMSSIPSGATAYSATQSWRCTLTDSTGKVTQGLVAITLQRTVAGGFTVSVPSTAFDVALMTSGPATAEVEVTATPSGATGTVSYVWSRVDPDGGSDFNVIGLLTASPLFQLTSSYVVSKTQTWRCTATDNGTGAVVVKDCAITLQVDA